LQEADWDLNPLNENSVPVKLKDHHFKLDYEASTKRATVRRSVNWMLSAVLLSFIVLVVCGCALPSFGIEVLGIVGLVIESGHEFEQANVFYSVFDLANMIMGQAYYLNTASDFVGLGTLASLLVITVFVVPLVQAVSLLVQWFAPMTTTVRMRNTVLNEVLGAWQYMEVYVMSIVIAAWQLGGVSEYMINAYCDPLKSTFTSLSYYGILDKGDAQCFRVNASVEPASWILVAASLILYFLNRFIVGASSQKAQDDDTPTKQRLHTDMWPESKESNASSTNMSNDAEYEPSNSDREVSVSPIQPRFTDYFSFATNVTTLEEQSQDYEAETAMLAIY